METKLIFKTSINCNGCKSTVKPFLDNTEGITSWEVDLESEDRLLTVHSNGITPAELIKKVEEAGYKAEEISDDNQEMKICH